MKTERNEQSVVCDKCETNIIDTAEELAIRLLTARGREVDYCLPCFEKTLSFTIKEDE
jgi:hypothetical protein